MRIIVYLILIPRTNASPTPATSDIDQAQFVMDVTKTVLPLYEQIFDVEYPLPKLDTLVVRRCLFRRVLT